MPGFKKLIFTLRLNKTKPPRIQLTDSETKRSIGSLPIDIEKPEDFAGWHTLSEEQQFELMMYVDNVRYAIEKLHAKPTLQDFGAIRIGAPDNLVGAMEQLYKEAQAQAIRFNPMDAMFNGLINYMRSVEKKLKKNNPTLNVLPAIGIELASSQEVFKKERGKYVRKIFSALLKVFNQQDKFLAISRDYNKNQVLADRVISLIAEGKSKASTWQVSCALSVLGKEKADFIPTFPPAILVELWLTPLLKASTITTIAEAKTHFAKTFLGIDDKAPYHDDIKAQIKQFKASQ